MMALRQILRRNSQQLVDCARLVSSSQRHSYSSEPAWGPDGRIMPHGNEASPVDLMFPANGSKPEELVRSATHVMNLTDRQACDVELLTVGAFSPLRGFMNEDAYSSVLENMRLPNGLLFGLPIVLDTANDGILPGHRLLLRYKNQDVAIMDVESRWKPNKVKETSASYGSTSLEHPAVQMVAWERGPLYLGGPITGLCLPERPFSCAKPADVRASLPSRTDVLAFQCRNPIHRAHYELFIRALDAPNVGDGAVCLVHPTVGPTQDDDIPGIVRYHTYEVLAKEVNNPRVRWAYLPYSMHMAGPREAIQHMIIRKNYGCTHFIIGRDMAGCKSSLTGEDFYGAYDAQDFAKTHAEELGMSIVPSLNVVYTEEMGYVTADVAESKGLHVKKLSGTKFRQMLRAGEEIPEWFAFSSVVKVLREHQNNQSA